ncbi:adenylylsulfate kinase [Desulfofarcimen acetoxidans DSM 771]|uniref:Adenylyl-sulfate kinase n=1 Tax=Desulfofarcimen acetoxidans (strain ATCC 49208 / DSM 771 / KCTC 5769 / VKM B-1644 / 5575) TaxID=485916 RepID=C8VYN9_DESAS|nr:adenylyl-sulfate kinase [Desulfofarcimen acetoxidans]ACV64760.1 adenylylsulfate kinase [Desulfofarcimen acetoxidans DSM 771]
MSIKAANIVWHKYKVKKEDRYRINGHKSCVLWITGLSGSGKSTLAVEVEKELYKCKVHSYVLDGDNIRHGLNKDLGFSAEDRQENIRRIGEVSKLLVDAGLLVISAFISPFREDRLKVRELFKTGEFIEIYVKCGLEVCEKRDPKGLYEKARQGIIKDFTGISSPYEVPITPELVVDTEELKIEECVDQVINYLMNNGYINSKGQSTVINIG